MVYEEFEKYFETARRLGDQAFSEGDFGQARVKYLEAIEGTENQEALADLPALSPDSQKSLEGTREYLRHQIALCDRELAPYHFQRGRDLYRQREFKKAIDEFELALELAPEEQTDFILALKKCLDRAKYKLTSALLLKNATPFALRGDDHVEGGDHALAVQEFEKALAVYDNAPPTYDKDRHYLQEKIIASKRYLVRPYLKRFHEARNFGDNLEAAKSLEEGHLLVDGRDLLVKGFLELLQGELEGGVVGAACPAIKNMAEWDKKIRAFEEARDKYYGSLSKSEWLPLDAGVFISNEFSENLRSAQLELAGLYEERAMELQSAGFKREAIENLDEAMNLHEGMDDRGFERLKKARHEINQELYRSIELPALTEDKSIGTGEKKSPRKKGPAPVSKSSKKSH